MRLSQSHTDIAEDGSGHQLQKELGLRDLVPMQILLVVGVTWAGLAARQGSSHVGFWLVGIATLFLPVAGVVHYCSKIWPLEGGVYQWTKHAIGPFAGFLSAWNFGIWALLVVSNLGIVTAACLSYALGPRAAWMAGNSALITALNIGLFGFILIVNIPGLRIGRWVAHFGTAVTLLVTGLLIILLFFHPHANAAHPHVSPQQPFSLAFPIVTLMSLNLFSKITFNSLTGLEQVAVFAGETRNAGRAILRSAWIAGPIIILIYICMTGAMLTYTSAAQIDLTAPIPQVLAAAFAGAGASAADGLDLGVLLGRGAILALAIATVAQYAVIIAEISRLPMVAAWDHLLPGWFTRLHPRYRTPTRSLAVIVVLAVLLCLLASAGTGVQEAFQLLVTSGNICYGINYLLMFAVPLIAGARFGHRPSLLLRIGCVSGMAVTLLQILFGLVPVVGVNSSWSFGLKVGLTALIANLAGVALYWRGVHIKAAKSVGANARGADTLSVDGNHRRSL
jgi:amino acid transporter